MNIKMRIVAASYRQSDVTVELYGRTDDNKSITALYYGFKPYFEYVPVYALLWPDGRYGKVETFLL